jgi:hypothetical protein
MVFALTRADYENLLADLAVKNDPLSLPVRSMIFFTMLGNIRKCFIFVDAWPTYNVIACVQETKEYAGEPTTGHLHPDFVSLYATPAVLSTRRASDQKTARLMLPGFLEELAAQRQWHQKGVVISALCDRLHAHIAKVFRCPSDGPLPEPSTEGLRKQGPAVKMLSMGPFEMQVYKQGKTHQATLPPGFSLDTLRKTDIATVLGHCHQKNDFPSPERHVRCC